jgi:L-amino acid N-acyltransferase YncA
VQVLTSTPQLRRASTDDGPGILTIYNEAIQRGEVARHTKTLSLAELAGALLPNADRYHTYVAALDGVIRGWAGFRPWLLQDTHPWTLELLVYVSPPHRGCGLGKALVKRTIAAAAAAEYPSIVALCAAKDAVAARLLLSSGFFGLGSPIAVFRGLERRRDVAIYQRMLIRDDGRISEP